MPYPTSITRPLVRLFDWYRRPGAGVRTTTDCTVLGVLPGCRPDRDRAGATQARGTTTLHRTVQPEHTGPNTRVFSPTALGVGTDTTDVLALLIDEGRTPATPREVRAAFRALHGHRPSTAEANAACTSVASFGLLA